MMNIENEDDLKSWYSINNKFKNIYKKYKEEWYEKHTVITEDVDEDGDKKETKIIGNRKYVTPRKKSKKATSQKKCAAKGKMQNTIIGGCRRKCKVGKEKIGSDGKCTKR